MENAFTIEKLRAAAALIEPFAPPFKIVESHLLTDGPFEDWSQVRSHGRAARRRKQGHKQRIRIYHTPSNKVYRMDGYLLMHPAKAREIRAEVASAPRRPER